MDCSMILASWMNEGKFDIGPVETVYSRPSDNKVADVGYKGAI